MLTHHQSNGQRESASELLPIASGGLLVVALVASLFFEAVNAEYFSLAGLSLIFSFLLAVFSGKPPPFNRQLLPLILFYIFWAWIGIAFAYSPAPFVSSATFWTIAFFPFAALTTLFIGQFIKAKFFVVASMVFIVASLALYASGQFLLFEEQPEATFANKNSLASLQVPIAFYVSYGAVVSRNLVLKALCLVLTALFVFTIGLSGSRGVLIFLLVGYALLFGFFLKDRWQRTAILALFLTVVTALVASNIMSTGRLLQRAETVLSPSTASTTRMIIWEGSLSLARDAPWHGIGPGLYPMVYPKYRLDEDRDAGVFAHNDYLQFLIEAGWPASLFLVAGLLLIFYSSIRAMLNKKLVPAQRMKLLIPALGIGAIAGHSLLSFNLFLPPHLLIMGVLVGLFIHESQQTDHQYKKKSATKRLPRVIFWLSAMIALLPTAYFLDTGRGTLFFEKAMEAYNDEDFDSALAAMGKAIEISPNSAIYHYSLVGLWYQKLIATGNIPNREELDFAFKNLDLAELLNPLRPEIHLIRARLLETLSQVESIPEWRQSLTAPNKIESEYRRALDKNPFYLEGRFYLARFLLKQNKLKEAQLVLEEGITKSYELSPLAVNYYQLTAEIRRIVGDTEGQQELLNRLQSAIEKQRKREASRSN